MPYYATHVPYGISDPSKRVISNNKIKDDAEFLKYGIETGGKYFSCHVTVGAGGGVPLHAHGSYGETFYPTKGTLGVVGDGTTYMTLEPGESYTVKPGEWHRFCNPSNSEPIEFRADVNPAHQGFEKVLHIVYGLAEDGLSDESGLPRSLYYSLLSMSMGQVTYPGIVMWFMSQAAKVVGWHAYLTGEEEKLVQRYYGRKITQDDKAKWKLD